MIKKIFPFVILFFIINTFIFSAFENVSKLELIIYGFTYTNSNVLEAIPTIENRMSNLEVEVLGEKGSGEVSVRAKKLYNFLYNDTQNISLVTRIEKLENAVLNRTITGKSLLTRIENIEEKAYGEYLRTDGSIKKRIERLEIYFEIKGDR